MVSHLLAVYLNSEFALFFAFLVWFSVVLGWASAAYTSTQVEGFLFYGSFFVVLLFMFFSVTLFIPVDKSGIIINSINNDCMTYVLNKEMSVNRYIMGDIYSAGLQCKYSHGLARDYVGI